MAFGEGIGFGSIIALWTATGLLLSLRVARLRVVAERLPSDADRLYFDFFVAAFLAIGFFIWADLAKGFVLLAVLESPNFLDFETAIFFLTGLAFLAFLAADLRVTRERLLFSLAVRLLIISSVTLVSGFPLLLSDPSDSVLSCTNRPIHERI